MACSKKCYSWRKSRGDKKENFTIHAVGEEIIAELSPGETYVLIGEDKTADGEAKAFVWKSLKDDKHFSWVRVESTQPAQQKTSTTRRLKRAADAPVVQKVMRIL